VAGDIRVGVGKCLTIFAMFSVLFAVPPTLMAASIGVRPPLSVTQILTWCAIQWLLGMVCQVSGRRAQERARMQVALVPAIERAMVMR
jgi:hypothetical protein